MIQGQLDGVQATSEIDIQNLYAWFSRVVLSSWPNGIVSLFRAHALRIPVSRTIIRGYLVRCSDACVGNHHVHPARR